MTKFTGKFGIERDAPLNSCSIWEPLSGVPIRGRWDHMRTTLGSATGDYMQLVREFPYIMGQCIEIDADNRRLRVFDPYGEPEMKDVATRLFGLISKIPREDGRPPGNGAEPEVVVTDATDEDIQEWMFLARKWLDKGKARPLTGKGYSEWPKMADIIHVGDKVRYGRLNEIEAGEFHLTDKDIEKFRRAGAASVK